MSRRSTSPRDTSIEEDISFLQANSVKASPISAIKYVPFSLLTSSIGFLIFYSVGSIDFKSDLISIIVSYVIGIVGLTIAYHFIAEWTSKQRKLVNRNASTGMESIFFSLFYNNAIYVFLLLICSSLIFSSLNSHISMILSQTIAAAIPAWLSSLSS